MWFRFRNATGPKVPPNTSHFSLSCGLRASPSTDRPDFLCDFWGRRLSLVKVDHAADSNAMLREFVAHRSEAAFAGLVRNHLDLVYSVALRRCGGQTGLAQDISQTVFTDFARKACTLPADIIVAGWLYQHASFVAATALRAEDRRRLREEIAMQLQSLADDTDWPRLAPLLDDALLELDRSDRDPIVLRYLDQRPLAEVGSRLGLSENAARMRVERALGKLRAKLAKRGVTSTTSALAVALTGQAVTAAPTALATAITSVALAAAVAGTTTSTVGFLALMASTKLKITGVAVLAATIVTSFLVQHRSLQAQSAENAQLRARLSQPAADQPGPSVPATVGDNAELTRLRAEHNELLQLRGEVARLRLEAAARAGQQTARARPKLAGRSEAAGLIVGYSLFESDPLGEHHVDTIKTMKLVGRALRQLANDADSLSSEARTTPLFADGQPAQVLRQNLAVPPASWGQVEILVPDLATLKQLMDAKADGIVARSKEDMPTPDGRLLRIYGKADGSVLNLVHDANTRALEFGDTPVLPP